MTDDDRDLQLRQRIAIILNAIPESGGYEPDTRAVVSIARVLRLEACGEEAKRVCGVLRAVVPAAFISDYVENALKWIEAGEP